MNRTFLIVLAALLVAPTARAQPAASAPGTPARGEKLSVETIKEKYWAKGEDSELRVVQNRLYSKMGRLELGASYGGLSGDPFLDTSSLGFSLGLFPTEYIGVEAFYLKLSSNESSAADALRARTRAAPINNEIAPDTNKPQSFMGGQLRISPLYGKLSLVGKSIIYFDLFAVAGAGMMKTENGQYLAPFVGLGQQVYLNRWLSLRLDYRYLIYNEDILSRNGGNIPTTSRTNYSSSVTLGLSAFINLFGS